MPHIDNKTKNPWWNQGDKELPVIFYGKIGGYLNDIDQQKHLSKDIKANNSSVHIEFPVLR